MGNEETATSVDVHKQFKGPNKGNQTGMRCSVRFCKKRAAFDKDVSFFLYPTDERRETWIRNCESEKTVDINPMHKNSSRVCGDHFESAMFLNPSIRNRLVHNAIPTLFSGKYLFYKTVKMSRLKHVIYS